MEQSLVILYPVLFYMRPLSVSLNTHEVHNLNKFHSHKLIKLITLTPPLNIVTDVTVLMSALVGGFCERTLKYIQKIYYLNSTSIMLKSL